MTMEWFEAEHPDPVIVGWFFGDNRAIRVYRDGVLQINDGHEEVFIGRGDMGVLLQAIGLALDAKPLPDTPPDESVQQCSPEHP